ncbi:MAG: oxygenase MpaB family protein, partial [Thermoleophilaceae bacterium]
VTEESAGRYPAGTAYDSRAEELKMWVHATLIDTAVLTYERFVGPLAEAELASYYEDVKRLGDQFGISRELQPQSWSEFQRYVTDTLASDEIAATETLRELGEMLRRPPLPLARVPVARVVNLFTAATLPPELRAELGLPWGRADAAALRVQAAAVRRMLPLMPPRYRYSWISGSLRQHDER